MEKQRYSRKIIHVDMDAFYASIEQRDHAELRGKPVAVGSSSCRGVVAAASYEARKYGVFSAMSSAKALKLCPQLIFVDHRFSVYKEVSRHIHSIFHDYTDLVEPLSLDEAYLDVTVNKRGMPSAVDVAEEIRARIRSDLSLTASAGVSFNKLLAKLASDMRKPNGLMVIEAGEELQLLGDLHIERLFGIGRATADRLHTIGIHTGGDLRKQSPASLNRLFGKQGEFFYNICRGVDNREVTPERERKSVGVERTFDKDLTTDFERITELYRVAVELAERLKGSDFKGKTLTLKVRFHNFEQHTRSYTSASNFYEFKPLLRQAKLLLGQIGVERTSIRLIGLSVSNPATTDAKPIQLSINF